MTKARIPRTVRRRTELSARPVSERRAAARGPRAVASSRARIREGNDARSPMREPGTQWSAVNQLALGRGFTRGLGEACSEKPSTISAPEWRRELCAEDRADGSCRAAATLWRERRRTPRVAPPAARPCTAARRPPLHRRPQTAPGLRLSDCPFAAPRRSPLWRSPRPAAALSCLAGIDRPVTSVAQPRSPVTDDRESVGGAWGRGPKSL